MEVGWGGALCLLLCIFRDYSEGKMPAFLSRAYIYRNIFFPQHLCFGYPFFLPLSDGVVIHGSMGGLAQAPPREAQANPHAQRRSKLYE